MGIEEVIEALASREPVEQHPYRNPGAGKCSCAAMDLRVPQIGLGWHLSSPIAWAL